MPSGGQQHTAPRTHSSIRQSEGQADRQTILVVDQHIQVTDRQDRQYKQASSLVGNILVDQHSQVTRLTDRGAGKQTDNTNKQPSSLVGNIQVGQHSQVTD